MAVPIDLLPPILDDLMTIGRPSGPARPWLGVYAVEVDDQVVVASTATGGPSDEAGLESGDAIVAVSGHPVSDLAGMLQLIWQLGPAGVQVPMTVMHDGQLADVVIQSIDRNAMLKGPRVH